MPCFHPRDIVVHKSRIVYNWIEKPDGTVVREKKPVGVCRQYTIQVPCGKCLACLALSQSQWSFRIEQEAVHGGHAAVYFVTFTYDNEHLPADLSVNKSEVQKYLHDLRQNLYRRYFDAASQESVPKVTYYFCAEYGSKRGRPHYHAILMFSRSVDWSIIQHSWNKGIVDIREFTSARAGYVAKYSVKQFDLDYEGRTPPFHLQSLGLGKCFLNNNSIKSLNYNLFYRNLSGRKVKLPRYYVDKLTTIDVSRDVMCYDKNGHLVLFRTKPTKVYRSYGFEVLSAMSEFRFRKSYNLQVAQSGLSSTAFEIQRQFELDKLEQSLINHFNNSSSYAQKSRIGL